MIRQALAALGLAAPPSPEPQKPGDGARSPKWPAARKLHLAAHPTCAACGRADKLEVHHVQPFHTDPSRELDPANLLTLCEWPALNCHLYVGHLGAWAAWNPTAREDAAYLLARHRARLS